MSVVSVEKDFDRLSLMLVAEFDASIERWQLRADPRQPERWLGPPTHPATVEKHDLAVGGEVSYFMTGQIKSNFFISPDGVVEAPDKWHFQYFDDERRARRSVPASPPPTPC
jgi:uncharacterized protein YndB with AHSA1/START domain